MDDKIKKIEELVELFKSNSITKEEYEFLKSELLDDGTEKSEKIDVDNVKPKIENITNQETQPQYKNRKGTFYHINKRIGKPILIVIAITLFYIFFLKKNSNDVDSGVGNQNNIETVTQQSTETVNEVTSNICTICGNKFDNRGYEEGTDGIWRELEDPYQGQICSPTCGRKHNEQFNDVAKKYGVDLEEAESNTSAQGDYKMGNDGRVYETNACGLCKGTGIETGRNMATGQTEGRVCPMCDGRGVRSY
jgi:hypothetical protein